jgi:hypothetical protein
MNTIKETIFSNWNFMLWIRLVAGIFFAYQGIITHDYFAGGIGGLFLFQSLSNTGCCGTQGCYTDYKHKNNSSKNNSISEIENNNTSEL